MKKKNEILLIVGILVIAACFFIGNRLSAKEPAAIVEVTSEGTVVHEFPLNLEIEVTVQGQSAAQKNHLVIKNGQAFIQSATCPDKICVNHAPIRESGQTIVCLPNKMVVTIK